MSCMNKADTGQSLCNREIDKLCNTIFKFRLIFEKKKQEFHQHVCPHIFQKSTKMTIEQYFL